MSVARLVWFGVGAAIAGIGVGAAAVYFMLSVSIRYDFRVMSEKRGTTTYETLYRVDQFTGETTVARDPLGESQRRAAVMEIATKQAEKLFPGDKEAQKWHVEFTTARALATPSPTGISVIRP